MAYIRILGVILVVLPFPVHRGPVPRQMVIAASFGEPVVSDPYDPPLPVHDDRANLSLGVLAPHRRQHRHGQKVLVPVQVITAFPRLQIGVHFCCILGILRIR